MEHQNQFSSRDENAKFSPFGNKVVFVLGATGTGKTRLSIDIATAFPAEIINSDKMQVYKGLDIVTNKATEQEKKGVRHHLLGSVLDPNADYTAANFCEQAMQAITQVLSSGRVPIIAGGSNSFIQALVEDPSINFKSRFDCFFLWLDVSPLVLFSRVAKRVDEMVKLGLVDEVREMHDQKVDYNRGVYRSIGVSEMDKYLLAERLFWNCNCPDHKIVLEKLLQDAINKTKRNTCNLTMRQVQKIEKLMIEKGWIIHKFDATRVFEKRGEEAEAAWDEMIKRPALEMVANFLDNKGQQVKWAVEESPNKPAPNLFIKSIFSLNQSVSALLDPFRSRIEVMIGSFELGKNYFLMGKRGKEAS